MSKLQSSILKYAIWVFKSGEWERDVFISPEDFWNKIRRSIVTSEQWEREVDEKCKEGRNFFSVYIPVQFGFFNHVFLML